MRKSKYSASDILRQLDDCARRFVFPMLDNGYVYLVDVRLHTYRDTSRWALLIEDVGYSPRAFSVSNCLNCYGNCLKREPGTANEDFLPVLNDRPEEPIFAEDADELIRDDLQSVRIRGTRVPVNTDPAFLASKGIRLEEAPRVKVYELARSLLPEHRDLLFATEGELRQRLPTDLPCILRLEEWHHPDLCAGELPSQSETFQQLAEVLTSGDVSFYRPTQPPNTHWSNWPEGGSL